jgi:hypothetical protein
MVRTNLHDEAVEAPRIVVHNDAASIADHFTNTGHNHQNTEHSLAPSEALVSMYEERHAEQCDEEAVGWQRWPVLEDAAVHCALCDGAFTPVCVRSFGHCGSCSMLSKRVWVDVVQEIRGEGSPSGL